MKTGYSANELRLTILNFDIKLYNKGCKNKQ